MEYATLNNGVKMPMAGIGTFLLTPDEAEASCVSALRNGYRLIDTAAAYFNEEAVGAALRKSGIPREELFIATKLWIQDAGYENAKQAFQTSLDKLGLDYLDLYLIHQPFGDYYGSWRAMEELYEAGKIRAIGVCNFYPERLTDLACNARIQPMVNQVELHPFFAQTDALANMKALGIQPEAWGPLAEGNHGIFTHPLLTDLGKKYGKTAAQTALRFLMQSDVVIIPKSIHKERMQQNFDLFDFTLTADDMAAIEALDGGESLFFSHYDPKTVEWFMSIL